jgi:hypothetical protein
MVARQPLATVREARYGYAVANMGSNPHSNRHISEMLVEGKYTIVGPA